MEMMNGLHLAARHGNINSMYELFKQNPSLLKEINDLGPFADNPLHTAATFGQTQFALEFMIIPQAPILVKKLNHNGFTPIHLAVKHGHLHTVRGLFYVDANLIRLKGAGGFTPLHTAVVEGRVDMLTQMVLAFHASMKDLTNHRETPLHLAVKNNQLKAFGVLVEHVHKFNFESIFLWKGDEGHTILHLMILHKRLKMLKGLAEYYCYMGTIFGINVTDADGGTALDILQGLEDYGVFAANVVAIRKILHQSGGIGLKKTTKVPFLQMFSVKSIRRRMAYNSMSKAKQMKTKTQNVFLVVAATIAAVTFLVGQNDTAGGRNVSVYLDQVVEHPSLLATEPYLSLVVLQSLNLVAFMCSVSMIFILTLKSPMRGVLNLMLFVMICSYILSMLWSTVGTAILGLLTFIIMVELTIFHDTANYASKAFKFHNDSDDDVEHLNDDGAA